MIDHESVLKAGKGAASLNDLVYCRVACEFTGGTKVEKKVDTCVTQHHMTPRAGGTAERSR